MRTAADRRAAGGFTLIEVVVALTIASLGLVALFDATSGGLMSVESAARHTAALRQAQSLMAELGVTRPLQPGELRGTDSGGFRWRIRMNPMATYPREDRNAPGLTLYAVETQVTWSVGKRERSVRLDSLRTGPAKLETK